MFSNLLLITTLSWALNNPGPTLANRVIEMNDRLVDIYSTDQRSFLVKFYAPWCHHCQELEPVWSQVAQQLHSLDSSIIVGRVDCTKYLSVASHFQIRGFPTILYINAQKRIEFKGDRNRDEIIDFALRVNGPPIRYLSNCEQITELVRDDRRVVFINFGPEADANFTHLAPSLQPYDWFFRSIILCNNFQPGVYVLKSRNIHHKYNYEVDGDMQQWIRLQRFPHFTRLTSGNLHMALSSHKLLAIALVSEFRSSGRLISQPNVALQKTLESVSYSYQNRGEFLFGYMTDLITINSIAIRTIRPIPNVLVLNSSTIQYYLFTDQHEEKELSQTNLVQFLDDILHSPHKVVARGGDTYMHRFLRLCFDAITTLLSMYQGNPVLTLLLFGLPGSFLAIIVYMTCCSDFIDAKDEEEEELLDEDEQELEYHEKRE